MTTDELIAVCNAAEPHPTDFGAPIEWLAFRRLLGPVEIRLLLEEHAALGETLAASGRKGGHTGDAHRAAHAALSALVMPLSPPLPIRTEVTP